MNIKLSSTLRILDKYTVGSVFMGVIVAAVVVMLIQSKETVMGFLIFYSKTPNQNVKHQCVETLRFMFALICFKGFV